MSQSINKYGLSRTPSADVKRTIRQTDGFGCVMCGSGITHYEHIDPLFVDAKEHNPEHMTLLCPTCHGRVTNGIVSKDLVWAAKRNPITKQKGFSNDWYYFNNNIPTIEFAGTTIENCPIPIMIAGEPMIKIEAPISEDTPFLLSANFYDSDGNISLSIVKNEWRALNDNWDVEYTGRVLTIRERARAISLKIEADPPTGIAILRVNMRVGHFYISGDTESFTISQTKGAPGMSFSKCLASNCNVGFSFG